MKNIAEFIEQIECGKHHFNIWTYTSTGHYEQFVTQSNKPRTSPLQEAVKQHLQVVVEVHDDEIDNAFLLLPEVQMVVPVNFDGNQVLSITRPQAA